MGARLNQRLLTFSRRRKLAAEIVNLNDQVLSMSELLRRTLGELISIATELRHDLWLTRADRSEIENAILNLAINARDAMPSGGHLRLETRNTVIDQDAARLEEGLAPGEYVCLAVTDTGTGMGPDIMRRAFEPFFTTKEAGKGTGLGLSTIYGFVKQSQGHVTIYSEVGIGTTVNVYLPRIAGTGEDATKATVGPPVQSKRGEAILVVEDNPQVRALTVERLVRLGYRVIEAENGPAALATLERLKAVDLIFSDVVMPGGLSGFQLAQTIKTANPAARVLLTSGFSEEAASNNDAGQRDIKILRKPYSLAELSKSIREALEG